MQNTLPFLSRSSAIGIDSFFGERKVHPSMSEGKLHFVFSGLNQAKTWLRSYSWIGVQRLVRLLYAI